jgi:hypothetical protein
MTSSADSRPQATTETIAVDLWGFRQSVGFFNSRARIGGLMPQSSLFFVDFKMWHLQCILSGRTTYDTTDQQPPNPRGAWSQSSRNEGAD